MMRYLTNCVNSSAELIGPMVNMAREIKLSTFLKYVDHNNFAELQRSLGYTEGGLQLKDDYHVRYFKSKFDGQLCVFMVHSAIEYVFTHIY